MADGPTGLRRSYGLSVAAFGDGAFVYDVVTDMFHRVGPVAAALLGDDTDTDIDVADIVDTIVVGTGADRAGIELEITAGLESLAAAGLVGRLDPYWVPTPVAGSDLQRRGDTVGAAYVVHDRRVVFRSPEPALLAEIETRLGGGTVPADSGDGDLVFFDVATTAEGRILLNAAEEWDFPTAAAFFAQLPGVVNDLAVRSHTVAVLHAGGVLTPSGQVLLISGAAEAGKSTLVGALCQQGCAYLGDELIGIDPNTNKALPYPKPLELDATSCAVLGVTAAHPPNVVLSELAEEAAAVVGGVGPVDAVVLSAFQPDSQREVTRLDVEDAAKALLNQTMNMRRVREPGLQALCDLAATTPVTRIVHGDSVALAADLVSGEV